MKKLSLFSLILSASLLSGCGKAVAGSAKDEPEMTETETTSISTEPSSEVTTAALTTTAVSAQTSTAADTTAVSATTSADTTQAAVNMASPAAPAKAASGLISCKSSVEVYSSVRLADLINENNVDLEEPDMLIDTSEVGTRSVNVRFSSDGTDYEQTLDYTVADTTDPVLLNSGWGACHIVNTPFDLNNYVGYADNYDRDVTLTYSGTVDPNTVGSYPITATITDDSGNSTTWDLTINVAESIPPYSGDFEQVAFSDFCSRYAGEGRKFGIDVSTWQGDIDFNAVKEAGCDFVIIRIGYYYDHMVMDDYFRQNLENAKAAGLPVGIYFYSADNSEAAVREHASWIAEQLNGTPLDFPVAFDWEEFGTFQEYHMSIHDLNQYYLAFADEMKKCGYTTMLYSSKNFFNNFWSESTKASSPIWLAHYVDSTDYTGKYAIWQASCSGKIAGIAGNVDMNILYDPLPLA